MIEIYKNIIDNLNSSIVYTQQKTCKQTCNCQADIRMRSHGLRQLVDENSVAVCQQTCFKLIVKTCYSQACCKLLQQVVTSLQMTSCNKPDFKDLLQLHEIDN